MPWIFSLDFIKKHGAWLIVAALAFYIVSLRLTNANLRVKLAEQTLYSQQQNAGILALKSQQEAQVERNKKLEVELAQEQKKSVESGRATMSLDISKECDTAIQEGIALSKSLKWAS